MTIDKIWFIATIFAIAAVAIQEFSLSNYERGDGYGAIDQALNDGEPDAQLSPAIDAAISAAMKDES